MYISLSTAKQILDFLHLAINSSEKRDPIPFFVCLDFSESVHNFTAIGIYPHFKRLTPSQYLFLMWRALSKQRTVYLTTFRVCWVLQLQVSMSGKKKKKWTCQSVIYGFAYLCSCNTILSSYLVSSSSGHTGDSRAAVGEGLQRLRALPRGGS